MHFLPDVYVQCDVCKGKRYNRETLEITFKGKSIADVLDMTVDEAADFFKAVPSIREKLTTLQQVGLGYIHVGQPATTLSGGEAQRVKLSKELSRRATGRTLYILDEPTTGLHFDDVRKLLEVLHALVEQGNTVVVIEHNLDVIKTADWIIDLGPEGGDKGGRIVAAGTPEDVALRGGKLHRPIPRALSAQRTRRRRRSGRSCRCKNSCHPGNRASARLSGTHELGTRQVALTDLGSHEHGLAFNATQISRQPGYAHVPGSRAPSLTLRPRDDKRGHLRSP